ncbi:MAG TPA: hypothetical protein VGO11_27065 [Chthoniobacteraceae bacterium]|jgi:hypothetical protein|nr:hypothetical protein [Chthoniobacteraceae bacterium]
MSLLTELAQLDFMIVAAGSVITIALAVPAYKRTKQKGFMLWIFAALFGFYNSVCLHTIGADQYRYPAGYHFVHYSYRILFVVDGVLGTIGTIMVINGYLRLFAATSKTPPVIRAE